MAETRKGAPVRAVLWDFGGVLTSSPFEAFNQYEDAHGIPRDFIRGINATNPHRNAWARFERSEIDVAAFDASFEEESREAGHAIPGCDVIALLAGSLRPRMVRALQACRAHFTCTCLTNNVRAGHGRQMARSAEAGSAIDDVMALFHHVIESSKVGLRKPDPEIYRLACEMMGVAPERVVYLDDLGVNLKPARAMGMRTIKVVEPDVALEELADATGLRFA